MNGNKIQRIFTLIDSIIEQTNSKKKEPEFSNVIKKRRKRKPTTLEDDEVLRWFAKLIAFSQNAKSDLVGNILDHGVFDDVFDNFKVQRVAQLDPETLKTRHWEKIKVIRFKKKINSIVGCAKSLKSIESKYGSFFSLLQKCGIPPDLGSEDDIKKFWEGFKHLKEELKKENTPFFKSTTSLLHFLLSIGYDCVKPDLVVMKVARKIGIVSSEKGEQNLVRTVKVIQQYSVSRKLKPSVVDFYFLIYGGQRWAKQFVKEPLFMEDWESTEKEGVKVTYE